MNLMLLFESDFTEDRRVTITGRRLSHLKKVIRPNRGDTVTVGLLGGLIGEGTLVSLDEKGAVLEVVFEGPPPPPLPVVLLMALPRPKSLFKSLQMATTLGVKDIHFFNSSRVEKSFWKSRELQPEAIEKHLILGLEQAVDTVLPTITFHRMFSHMVNDHLPAITEGRDCYLAHPEPGALPCPHNVSTPTVFAMGPERGLIDHEVRCFEAAGFKTIALGRRILRVEQALPVMLGKMFV